MIRLSVAAILLIGWLASIAGAFTPDLIRVDPRGGKRGTEMEFHLHGNRLGSPSKIIFHHPGIEVLELKPKDPKHLVARVRIADDAPLGEHPFRLVTKGGVSELRTVWIGQFETIMEAEPNDQFESPQKVELNTTIQGVAKSEDKDVYLVSLKKGQPLAVEVEAMRLGRSFFDVHLAILDQDRFELASCDDAPLLYTDAFATMIAPEDGDYRVVVREAAYQGNDTSRYRLHIGTFPRPAAVFPPGARPGENIEFRFLGDPAGELRRSIKIPENASGRFPVYAERDGLLSPSPNWIQVSPLPTGREHEPNNSQKSATPAPALPTAIHGIISTERDQDWFRFSAKKNEKLEFRVLARALRSPLDPMIVLRDPKNKGLANNDDQSGPDSFLKWTCPADGDYTISVRDKLERSGADFTYRLEIDRQKPSISALLPVAERNKSQKRKMISIPRGSQYATVVNITRSNLGCAAIFEAGSLPPGVTMEIPDIPRSTNSFPVLFKAEENAPLGGNYHSFSIKSTGEKTPQVEGPLREEIHHIEINNQGPYHSTLSEKIAVAVTEEAPFSITVEAPAAPIVQKGVTKLRVKANRQDGFDKAITLRFLWKPPGIGAPATITLPADKSEIEYEINANADAPLGDWRIAILGEANTSKGPVIISSAFVSLKVAEPFVTATIDLSATEQGRNTPVVANLVQVAPFEGEASAELIGLPHGTKTIPQEFNKDASELTFPIEVGDEAKVGKHNGLFLRLLIPANGARILHQTGQGGTLRIDKPAPVKTAAKVPKKKPDAPTKEKPLSRLEMLRQQGQ